MSPSQLNNLIKDLETEIPEINTSWLVVDDSQLSINLAERYLSENQYLVGVIPNYGTSGSSADSYRNTTQGLILVLEKTDYSELSQEELIDVFERTYQTAIKVRNLLFEKAMEGCHSSLRNLYVNSVQLQPEWKLADCNGWSLSFDID